MDFFQDLQKEVGISIDAMIKRQVENGFLTIEEDARGTQFLVKGARIDNEIVTSKESNLQTHFQEVRYKILNWFTVSFLFC